MRFASRGLLLAIPLCLSCSLAGARFVLAPGFPWTYSVTGSETVTSLAMDSRNWVWTAGNVYSAASGQDLLLLVWTRTHPGEPYLTKKYDIPGWSLDEPSIVCWKWLQSSGDQKDYAFLALTGRSGGYSFSMIWRIDEYFASFTPDFFLFPGGLSIESLALNVEGSGTPYVTGSVIQGGVKHLLYYRYPRKSSGGSFVLEQEVSATWWTGSGISLEGRGVVPYMNGAVIMGAGGGDLWLLRYKSETFADPTPMTLKAEIDPAFDPPRRIVTPAIDEPWAMKKDVYDNFWVVGSSDGSAAVWKFSTGGALQWMVNPLPGTSSTLYALSFDASGNCLTTGVAGNGLVLLTVGPNGSLLDDARPTAGSDTVTPRGLAVNADGSVWVGATLSSAPSSPVWRGTCAQLYYFIPDPGPAVVARGGVVLRVAAGATVRGPSGVINPRMGERLSILVRAAEGGNVRAQVMNMRGEVVREFTEACSGGSVVEFLWDGRSVSRGDAAPGVYLLRVSGGGVRVMKKVVVTRHR